MRHIGCLLILAVVFSSVALWAASDKIEAEYDEAAQCYHQVKALPAAGQSRAKWFDCIVRFNQFSKKYSKSGKAADAVFSAGLAYRNIFDITKNEEDASDAITKFNEVVRMYSRSNLADDALYNVGVLKWKVIRDGEGAKNAMLRILNWYPEGDMAASAKNYLMGLQGGADDIAAIRKPKPASRYVILSKIERSEVPKGEKITLDLSGPVDYRESYGNSELPNLSLYTIELNDAYLSRTIDNGYSYVGNGIVRDVKPSQVNNHKAEINFVIREGNHCIVTADGPPLTIMCKPGPPAEKSKAPLVKVKDEAPAALATPDSGNKLDVANNSKQLVIVIDPGHGGEDEGAVGPDGTQEKDIVLQIAKRLGWQLRNKLNAEVEYTRIDDRFVSLDDRNTIAKAFDADLFISIHANAAESNLLTGYQTFFLNNASDEASRRLAARENATLNKNIDDLEKIILTMMQNMNTDESRALGQSIHKKVLSKMSTYGLRDRGLKSALFYVLVGAKCPAVLIETSFISNPEEEKKLNNPDYQESIARAIADGIREYVDKT